MNELKETDLVEETSALKVRKLTFWEAALTIVGADVGAGILGLAYSCRKAGWPILVMWIVIAGAITTIAMLYIAETTMRTKTPMQLPGLARKYVGSFGSILIFFAMLANSMGCLLAYTCGSGKILNELFGISPALGSILFTIPAFVVIWVGLKATGVAEKFLSSGMIVLLAGLVLGSFLSGKADLSQAIYARWIYAGPVFNVAIFCYIAQYAIPELARGLRHKPQELPKAIITGMCITGFLLALVPLIVISLTGPENVTEVATIAWGKALGQWAFFAANLFALSAMMTSYWATGESLLTAIVDLCRFKSEEDFKTRLLCISLVILPPFILGYSGLVSFVDAIYWAGTFGGIIMATLPILMFRSARKRGDIETPWQCGWYANGFIQFLMILFYGGAAVYAILNMTGYLPSAW